MIKIPPVHINKWLIPFSWLYGLIIWFRNSLFAIGILKSKSYNVPVICVGNITVGGTGKTPHIEYLIRLLKDQYRLAVLSRGYGRKTSGYILANKDATSDRVGDEPFQIYSKFPEILVAVDGNRRRGIENLMKLENPPQIILLDDAFQHRYVKPSLTILLTNFNRLMYFDNILPAGRLRESINHASEADVIITTKCPDNIDFQIVKRIDSLSSQYVKNSFYTKLSYSVIQSLFSTESKDLDFLRGKHILLVTGIASPQMLIDKLKEYTPNVTSFRFSDHHNFSEDDINKITSYYNRVGEIGKLILVTEKDAVRLKQWTNYITEEIRKDMYYIPVEISFIENDFSEKFNKLIEEHVSLC